MIVTSASDDHFLIFFYAVTSFQSFIEDPTDFFSQNFESGVCTWKQHIICKFANKIAPIWRTVIRFYSTELAIQERIVMVSIVLQKKKSALLHVV